jgi:carbon monoxide dehydrogenase subunit G
VPFSFDLQCFIDESGPDTSRVKLQFNADLSPMLMMMASRPLGNFINILAVKLKEICESAS